jgi:hypothetical protein
MIIMDLRKHKTNEPKNEMEARIQYEFDYLTFCETHHKKPDLERIKTGIANAYAAGIVSGTCKPGFVFDFNEMQISDTQFKIMIEALITRSMNRKIKPEKFSFNLSTHNLTDESLVLLGKALNHKRFPAHISIDLSSANNITNAGANVLLKALRRDTCNLSVVIKMPHNPKFIEPGLLRELNSQLNENLTNYKPTKKISSNKKVEPAKAQKEKNVKKKATTVKSTKKGLFASSKKQHSTAKKDTKRKSSYSKV